MPRVFIFTLMVTLAVSLLFNRNSKQIKKKRYIISASIKFNYF